MGEKGPKRLPGISGSTEQSGKRNNREELCRAAGQDSTPRRIRFQAGANNCSLLQTPCRLTRKLTCRSFCRPGFGNEAAGSEPYLPQQPHLRTRDLKKNVRSEESPAVVCHYHSPRFNRRDGAVQSVQETLGGSRTFKRAGYFAKFGPGKVYASTFRDFQKESGGFRGTSRHHK